MQYTPGPWKLVTTGTISDAPALWNVTDGKGTIAEIVSHNQSDARLIASAPELLDALIRLAHPMADDEDLSDAKELIERINGN